jgi:murein DD-endopeptidase MepM/ murein hydrolase activator NlpD
VRPFAPKGSYGGHWGIDLEAEPGAFVRAAASGTVTFAGSVAGIRSVTVHHGGGLRTSYSYLSAVMASRGPVDRGSVVGLTGVDHGVSALHFSLRLRDRYLDPMLVFGCTALAPAPGLRLLPVGTAISPPS